jgi:2-oxoglutarate dehydrogenase E2 component (dihydrolipoamide succinyltransferase)
MFVTLSGERKGTFLCSSAYNNDGIAFLIYQNEFFMSVEIKIPSPGESITQVQLARWLVSDGMEVEQDQEVAEIDSDKASFPISAPVSGRIALRAAEGDTIAVGAVIAVIEATEGVKKTASASVAPVRTPEPAKPAATEATPLARKIIVEQKVDAAALAAVFPGKKVTRKDIESYLKGKKGQPVEPVATVVPGSRDSERKKLTTLRLKLAERLVSVKNETAMLTTFNEVDMSAVISLKEKYNESFKEKFGTGLGFMSFFTKAVTLALQEFPQVNSMIDGDELVTPHFVDIGIAVSAPKGLVVPVLRNTESMSLAEIEKNVKELAGKARDGRISIDDMKGGTFTITNGGVFGSMMSTPILNPPQSAILGMHKIVDRPVAIDGKVVVRPMMYLALSYDHRVIDGRESVSFLVRVKELIEEPVRMLTLGMDPDKLLLDL